MYRAIKIIKKSSQQGKNRMPGEGGENKRRVKKQAGERVEGRGENWMGEKRE